MSELQASWGNIMKLDQKQVHQGEGEKLENDMRPRHEQALFNDAVHLHRLKSMLPTCSTSITEEHTGK